MRKQLRDVHKLFEESNLKSFEREREDLAAPHAKMVILLALGFALVLPKVV